MPSLEQIQQALAARLTQPRQASSPDVQDVLAGFDAHELDDSQETLRRKRLSQLGSMLPSTKMGLGDAYEALARSFMVAHHFHGMQAIRLEAITFARWLKSQPHVADFVKELAAWEALRVEWISHRYFFRIKKFKYRVDEYGSMVTEPEIASNQGGSIWLAWRCGRWGTIQRIG